MKKANISLSDLYWNGYTFTNITSLLPFFDVRLKMDASYIFNNSTQIWNTFSFSGNLYYQSNSSTDKVKMKLSKYHIAIYNNRLKDCSMEMYC